MAGVVYEKFDPGEPGLFRNADRQLGAVLVVGKAPDEFMYSRVLAFWMATWPWAICRLSSSRPLTRIRASVNTVPLLGASRSSRTIGGVSPGYTGYRELAAVVLIW